MGLKCHQQINSLFKLFTHSYFIISLGLNFCQTTVLGLGLGVDFTFARDNHKNHNHKNHKNDNNPHLNFVKGTILGDKEQGVGIRDKG